MEFSSDVETRKIPALLEAFFENVLFDEEPIFVSGEATITILDVSTAAADELLKRCSEYYRRRVSLRDLKQPSWKLLRQLA